MIKIATINKITKKVKRNVDKNQKLPTFNNYTQPQYAYLLAQSVITPNKNIKSIKVAKTPNAPGISISRSIDKVDYINLAKDNLYR